MRNTIVINAFGGPGSGKTTACFQIACELKKKGYVVEYVPEYAKELVWDQNCELLDGSFTHQNQVLNEQKRRIDRLVGKVDFIVTDAPLLFNIIYLNASDSIRKLHLSNLLKIFKSYNNFNFFVKRDEEKFEEEGRMQNLEESRQKDQEIMSLLQDNDIYCGKYSHRNVSYIANNAINTLRKLNSN